MGYALMSARKIMLTNRVSTINFQLMNLNQAKQAMSNQTGNLQRQMNAKNNLAQINYYKDMLRGFYGEDFQKYWSSQGYEDDYFKLYDKYAQVYLIESDIDAQIKQLETQLKAANEELKNLEEGEKNAISNGTPKYA